ERTRAIIAVDYAGQPADYTDLHAIADAQHIPIVADACHALGATYRGRTIGHFAEMSVFSLHPAKHITSGEGGMVACNNATTADRLRRFRSHGINIDAVERQRRATYAYDMVELGYNYRLTDFQAALALSQLNKLTFWLERRQELAARY